ncbi:hypothetical protein N9B67_03810 [Algibacter sp.]|nr:hypothetical protein [Algibacter sp.]
MNKQRLAILTVAGLGVLATFLPWVKVPILGSVNGTQGDGWITLVLFAIAILISLSKDKTKAIEGGLLYAAILPGGLAGALGLWKIIDFNSKMEELGGNVMAEAIGSTVSIGIGLYLVVLAGIALPIVGFLIKDKKEVSE